MTIHRSIWAIALVMILTLAGCSEGKTSNEQFQFLNELGINADDKLLLGDTVGMPDIYCGDPGQTVDDLQGKKLSQEQYQALVQPAGAGIADAMSNWLLLGVRDMGGGITLAAYYAGNGVGYCVDLITYDKLGQVLDAINTREMHLLWRVNMSDINNDSVYTLDSHVTIDGDALTLHRVMGRCVMDFEKEVKGAPLWQQAWQQRYTINGKGHFILEGQQVVDEQGTVDYYAAMDFKSWDMLVCSRHDAAIMDTWNSYVALIEATYPPDYEYNPFPQDVALLYKMNPKRFLLWMASPKGSGSPLQRYFKLPPSERPALLHEVARLDDSSARQRLTSMINSWDDKPLTRHL